MAQGERKQSAAMLIANGILTPEGKLNRDMVAEPGWKGREEDLALLDK